MTLSCRRCLLVLNIISACRPIQAGDFDPIIPFLAFNYLSADLLLVLLLCSWIFLLFYIHSITIGEMLVIFLTGFGSLSTPLDFSVFSFWVRESALHRTSPFSLSAHQSSRWLPSGSLILDCLVPMFS